MLMGLRLTTAESWFAQRADDLAPELRDYVKASIDRRDVAARRKMIALCGRLRCCAPSFWVRFEVSL